MYESVCGGWARSEEADCGDGKKETHMLGTGIYPITIAEMHNYTEDADKYFELEEHEKLKNFLALDPESGRVIADTGGVRMLEWPINPDAKVESVRVIYYFRDLNMPIYMLALYRRGEHIPLDAEAKREINGLVDELVAQHSQEWAAIVKSMRKGSNDSA